MLFAVKKKNIKFKYLDPDPYSEYGSRNPFEYGFNTDPGITQLQ